MNSFVCGLYVSFMESGTFYSSYAMFMHIVILIFAGRLLLYESFFYDYVKEGMKMFRIRVNLLFCFCWCCYSFWKINLF